MGTNTTPKGGVFLRAIFIAGLTASALLGGANAWAGVGVTSAADGEPLGKPPNENERVLRIGIDVQANELVTTGAVDRAHLVFIDGSSLTVGPNARLTIDKFVFDPNSKTGELAVNATKGVFRLVGGKISKTNAITITTPSSTIGIRGGITILNVTQNQTAADFIFGTSMTVTARGRTETATRAGSQVVTTAGGVPGSPTLLKQGSLNATLGQLEGKVSSNKSPDQTAQNSGYSKQNSDQSANTATNVIQNGPPNTSNNILTNALSNATAASQLGNSTPVNTPTNAPSATSGLVVANSTTTTIPTSSSTPTGSNTPTPSGPTPTPTTQTQTGFANGLVIVESRHGRYRSTDVHQLNPGTVSITTNSNNRAKGTIEVGYGPATATLELSGRGGSNTLLTTDPSGQSTVRVGDRTIPINDNTVLASSTSRACKCEFLNWGVWASTVPDPRNNGTTYVGVGTYVAGTPTPQVQLPQSGTATYNGFMAGFASNNGIVYGATGSYQNAWNFQSGRGAFNGTFDGRSYSGSTAATTGSNFSGTFNGGSRTGSLNGGFFASPTDPAAYQAGTFSIRNSSSTYQASGIFAGQR